MKQKTKTLLEIFTSQKMRKLLWFCFFCSFSLAIFSTYYDHYTDQNIPDEQIDAAFKQLKSKYGIKIVYKINDDFLSPIADPIIPAGPGRNSKVTPIRHRTMLRYPLILEKALQKYPLTVIKNYLSGIYFAGEIMEDDFRYGGTYDPFRRIIFIIDGGREKEEYSIYAFHHEFSSLLLKRHSLWINPWLDNNPKNFTYLYKRGKDSLEVYNSTSLDGTEADYEKGFMDSYGQTNFENDFNEYSAMIFTYPEKFKRIMDRYPRVRGKFLVWLKFYQQIDPVFTEAYLFGQAGK